MSSVCFQGNPFNITIIHFYILTSNAEEAKAEWFYEELLELTPPKRCPFHYRELECKEVKKYLEEQANLALEYRMKQGKR